MINNIHKCKILILKKQDYSFFFIDIISFLYAKFTQSCERAIECKVANIVVLA